jgi:predicted GIY-YIG superfamily endonuclease
MATRTIYLIHFSRKLAHAGHYVGSTDDLAERIEAHNGARLMEVITVAGISWEVVRTWNGSRQIERRIKNRKEAPALCPICSGKQALKRCVNPAGGK